MTAAAAGQDEMIIERDVAIPMADGVGWPPTSSAPAPARPSR